MACRTWEQYEHYILQEWSLTRREVQVALECMKGNKNKEIASRLGISAETVNKTLDNVYRTTGVNSRDQLVAKLLIADIDNTPLQQAITLVGEGSALVGAGFLATLYESRSERKRPRSLQSGLSTSKTAETSRPVRSSAATGDAESQVSGANVAVFVSVTSESTIAEQVPAAVPESLAWMSSPEMKIETSVEN